MLKDVCVWLHGAQWSPSRRKKKKTSVRFIIVKLLKTNKKEKILKAPRGREDISHLQSHEMSPPSLQKREYSLTAPEGVAGGVNPEFFIQQTCPLRIKVKEILVKSICHQQIAVRNAEETKDGPSGRGRDNHVNTRVFGKEGRNG